MYQKVTVLGNLGKDPEVEYTPSGTAITKMDIAANRTFKRQGETVKETTWFTVKVWGKQGENCANYLKKGSTVLVDGTLTSVGGNPRAWVHNGKAYAKFEIAAHDVKFVSGTTSPGFQDYENTDDQIPF